MYESDGTTEVKLAYDISDEIYYPSSTGLATITSPLNGVFYIVGLDAGTYIIKETKAPTGFTPIDTEITITNATGYSSATVSTVNVSINKAASTEITATTVEIVNKSTSALPETGGIGTLIFYVLGASLISFGSFIIYKRRT